MADTADMSSFESEMAEVPEATKNKIRRFVQTQKEVGLFKFNIISDKCCI